MRTNIVFLLTTLAVSPCWSQTCVQSIAATTFSLDYSINLDGTVTDTRQNIMWTQCSLGQHWLNGKCVGEILELSWSVAKHQASEAAVAGFRDWRLPSIHELSRIAELQCQQPSINLTLFPTTLPVDYWTVTEFINNTDMAWLVHFAYGENHTGKKLNPAAVRLIRSIDNSDKD